MNLLILKQQISQIAFEIYKYGEDLEIIANQIEALMNLYNITFVTENVQSKLTSDKGTIVKTAHDRFIEALDADEIKHAQHMKAILQEHCNFLHATWVISKQAA